MSGGWLYFTLFLAASLISSLISMDESNCRKVYEAPDTQEKLFSLFYGDKKIEGLKEYFELLDANVLGQNEIAPDIPVPRQHVVLTVENFDALEPKKSDDALAPKRLIL